MAFDLQNTIDILKRTPFVMDALLRRLDQSWTTADEGPDTWSPIVIIGHLIHGEETDWIPRAQIILEHGTGRPFDPYDRFAQFKRFGDWPMERLLDRFADLRESNLQILAGWELSETQLSLPGQHPALGAVTLRQLLATWAAHDLGHIAQVVRAMAKYYKQDVGPWVEYLSIMNR